MCLIVEKNKKFSKAETDIEVFKVLIKNIDDNGNVRYVTPYKKMVIDTSKEYENTEELNRHDMGLLGIDVDMIEGGVYHCYKTLERASITIPKDHDEMEIWRCIIPKGTDYIDGMINDIATKGLKFIEPVKN